MKENPITIGIDDAKFKFNSEYKTTLLIGVICQGIRMVGISKRVIEIDGNDATRKLIELIEQNEMHVQYTLTHTITFAGFNLINLKTIYNKTGKPIIAITEREVNLDSVKSALIKRFPEEYKSKLQNIIDAGNLYEFNTKTAGGFSRIFFQVKGIELKEVENLVQKISIDSKLPECIRLAHLIGTLF